MLCVTVSPLLGLVLFSEIVFNASYLSFFEVAAPILLALSLCTTRRCVVIYFPTKEFSGIRIIFSILWHCQILR